MYRISKLGCERFSSAAIAYEGIGVTIRPDTGTWQSVHRHENRCAISAYNYRRKFDMRNEELGTLRREMDFMLLPPPIIKGHLSVKLLELPPLEADFRR